MNLSVGAETALHFSVQIFVDPVDSVVNRMKAKATMGRS